MQIQQQVCCLGGFWLALVYQYLQQAAEAEEVQKHSVRPTRASFFAESSRDVRLGGAAPRKTGR